AIKRLSKRIGEINKSIKVAALLSFGVIVMLLSLSEFTA
ncbi:hypothetical protein LCGC14_2722250, partial [marine sediment metagenome]